MRRIHGFRTSAHLPHATRPVLGAMLLLAGCSLVPPAVEPEAVRELPAEFPSARVEAEHRPRAWWRTFRDPVLDRLVEAALSSSPDLRTAVARVEEVRARYGIARSPLFPALDAQASYSRQDQPANTGLGGVFLGGGAPGGAPGVPPDTGAGGGGGTPGVPDRFTFATYSASLGFAYEVDFWGRVRNDARAAFRDALAAEADLRTARLAVVSETIATYFEVVEVERRIALTRESADLLAERDRVVAGRYRSGLATPFEVYAVRQQLREAEAALPPLRAARHDLRGRLAVAVGRYPGALDDLLEGAPPPALDLTPIPAGLPSALLRERPDVRAAALRLEAARFRIGARRAERFPSFPLTGSAGVQSRELTGLLSRDQYFTSFLGSLAAPLFQGGRIRAGIRAAEAQYEQQAAGYARTVLVAFQEVEAALASFQRERERYALLVAERETAEGRVESERARLQAGVGDALVYLDARRNLVQVTVALAAAETQLARGRLAVHRALGGAWVGEP